MYKVVSIALVAVAFAPATGLCQFNNDSALRTPAAGSAMAQPAPAERVGMPQQISAEVGQQSAPASVDGGRVQNPGPVPGMAVHAEPGRIVSGPARTESVATILGPDEEWSLFDVGTWSWPSWDPNCSTAARGPRPPHCWASIDALFMWEKRQSLPSGLITLGSPGDPFPGAIRQPNTTVVSPDTMGHGLFGGGRITAGAWVDSCSNLGIEASGFLLQDRGSSFDVNSSAAGNPLLALSRIDQPSGIPNAFVFGPPLTSAGISLRTDSQLGGAELNGLITLIRGNRMRVTALVGSRYLGLQEQFSLFASQQGPTSVSGPSLFNPFGPTLSGPANELTQDSFKTRNDFVGGQFGLRGEYDFAPFFVTGDVKFAMGGTEESINTAGYSAVLPIGGIPVVLPGGLYALPSNSGHSSKTKFSYVPELLVKGGVDVTSWCRATVGYDLLYWSRVLRPGDQIDLNIDPRQVPTSPTFQPGFQAASPHSQLNQSTFWAQGVTVGLELRY